jgi:AmmeMemoRadiSam system protein B
MHELRPAAVAGLFYPAAAAPLTDQVDRMLADASASASHGADEAKAAPKALIVPHAGYVYSGPIAASAYARLAPLRGRVERVVLLGPAHRVHLRGLAFPDCKAFATPLGPVEVDVEAPAKVPWIPSSAGAHAAEHSLEVHLPFLVRVLGRFTLVPLVVGTASTAEVANAIEALWGDDRTLVVVSSDLSHYLPYAEGRSEDEATARRILSLEPGIDHEHACGATPVNGLLEVARRKGLDVELLDLRSSGDTAGPRDEVVGYGAFAFFGKEKVVAHVG